MVALDFNLTVEILKPLVVYVFVMGVYSVFVFKFYRFLAKKNIIEFGLARFNKSNHFVLKVVFSIVFYVIEYIVLLPVFVFFWFGFLALLLIFLAKSQSLESILMIAMAVVGTVRVLSYYNEDLSRDLAKMLPFALLGVFLVDNSFFDLAASIEMIKSVTGYTSLLLYYLGFIVVLEIILRIFYIASFVLNPNKED